MRQFDVYANPATAPVFAPYVVVLTSHYLALEVVLVAPLVRRISAVQFAEIVLPFEGEDLVLSLIAMAAVAPRHLRPRIGSLAVYETSIRRGLDRLFTGF